MCGLPVGDRAVRARVVLRALAVIGGHLEDALERSHVELNAKSRALVGPEFAILEVLMRNAGHPVSRAALLEEVWNMSPDATTNIADVYVKYVRDKIDLPGEQKLVHTLRGFGYELRDAQ